MENQHFSTLPWLCQTGYIRLHLDEQELLHLLHLGRLLPRPLPLLGVDLGPPEPVLVIHRKTIKWTILSIELHRPRLCNFYLLTTIGMGKVNMKTPDRAQKPPTSLPRDFNIKLLY